MTQLLTIFLLGLAIFAFIVLFLFFIPVPLWLAAWFSGAKVGLVNLIGMRIRRVPPKVVVGPRISAIKAGLNVDISALESHYLAGGNV